MGNKATDASKAHGVSNPLPEHTTTSSGIYRVAALRPLVFPTDVTANLAQHTSLARQAHSKGATVAVFPELSLTGYTCGDLFFQRRLLDAAITALCAFARETADLDPLFVVGLPLENAGRLFNCAAVIQAGKVLGIVPKTHLPARNEFYESRWFVSGIKCAETSVNLQGFGPSGENVPFGRGLIFADPTRPDFACGVEICEDLWSVEPPSGGLALAGATLLLNLSASPELLGKAEYRQQLVLQQSARCLAAYVLASAGAGESSADVVYSGHCLIAENGRLLACSDRLVETECVLLADVDLGWMRHERLKNASFAESAPSVSIRRIACRAVERPLASLSRASLIRPIEKMPFVPSDPARRSSVCHEVFAIQSAGLARRLRHTQSRVTVLGLSGGLDSTLALLVALRAHEVLGRSAEEILAVSMPGPGTSRRTRSNARQLAEVFGTSFEEIPIDEAVAKHLEAIGHPPDAHDIAFENAQARERTQILMTLANRHSGIVLGTGDLSEAALGWCTFNGDHMSMYHVNSGVPKTLVRHLVEWCAGEFASQAAAKALQDVLETPISPELLPPRADGDISQRTEESIGPYVLHDFFLHAFCRCGFAPEKIRALATVAFEGDFTPDFISTTLDTFLRRFFAAQFKRNATPDGPKVGSVSLSPRADWRMPSDAYPALFTS
jgi:NAD+ synthase (glutamine-hydrolysing)